MTVTYLDDWIPGGSPGAALHATGIHRVRTARWGQPGEYGVYHRYSSPDKFKPPYTWSATVRTVSTMIPPIFDEPQLDNSGNWTQECWYLPAFVIHPMYGTESTFGNDHNIVLGLGRQDDPTKIRVSAEMRYERPDRPYGARTGYVSRTVETIPNPWDGQLHDLRVEVLSHAHYQLWWDGRMVADIVEKEPATMFGACGLGLRLDFCDVEFTNMRVDTHPVPLPPSSGGDMQYLQSPTRLFDSRPNGRVQPGDHIISLSSLGVPAGVEALTVTITVLDGERAGYATLYPLGISRPNTSNINWSKGSGAIANTTVTRVANNNFVLYVDSPVHVLIDVIGYQ
jgi:hypothetical protein